MDTEPLTLTDFLLARIAEDEAANDWAVTSEVERCRADGMPNLTEQDVRDYWADQPWWKRRMAECEAKRRIVEFHHPSPDTPGPEFNAYCEGCWAEGGMDGAPSYPCRTVRWLAAPYADHESYDESWRP